VLTIVKGLRLLLYPKEFNKTPQSGYLVKYLDKHYNGRENMNEELLLIFLLGILIVLVIFCLISWWKTGKPITICW